MERGVSKSKSEVTVTSAFGLSLVLHLVLFLALEGFGRLGWLRESALSEAVAAQLAEEAERSEPVEFEFQIEPEIMPTQYVDADPSQASEEEPESTPYYAVVNAVAGDDDPEDTQEVPKIDGSQDKVLKTMDTPVMPAANQVEAVPVMEESLSEESTEESTEEASEAIEMLSPSVNEEGATEGEGEDEQEVIEGESEARPEEPAMIRPSRRGLEEIELEDSVPDPPPAPPRVRPRTLAEARRQAGLMGEKMKQDGGVKPFRLQSTPNLLATPFGDYDSRVIQAIQQRWFDILASMPTARNARGRVVLKFRMHDDGRVTDLEVVEDSVGVIQSLVCQKAVSEPAPFGRWPDAMRRLLGRRHREVRFSFFYN